MSSATVAALVPAIVGLVTAVAALIRAETAHAKVNAQRPVAKNNDTVANS